MRYIKQKYEYACYPACIAMIENISFDKACKLVDGRKTKHSWNVSPVKWKQVYTSLKKLKHKTHINYYNVKNYTIQDLKFLHSDAILVINCPESKTYTHAVVWDHKKTHDT